MKEKIKLLTIALFTILYLIFFTFVSFQINNVEFIYYTVLLFILIFIIYIYQSKINLDSRYYLGLSLLALMHCIGGNLYLGSTRVYDIYILFLRYDQIMHMVGSFLIAIILYRLLKDFFSKKLKQSNLLLPTTIVLLTLGIGATYEIIELISVIFFKGEVGVGDYFNNAYDLLFNLIGAGIAALSIIHKKKR